MATPTLDRLPDGDWYVLSICKRTARGREWVALLIDVDPESEDWPQGCRKSRECWFNIPGRHKDRDAAWQAMADACETRH